MPSAAVAMRRPVRIWVLRIAVAVLAVGIGLYGGFEYARRGASERIRLEEQTARLTAEQAAQQKSIERARLEAEEKRFREGAERAFEAMRKAEQEVQRERERRSKPAAFTPPLDRPMTTEEERRLSGGEEFQECNDCPRMVVVPAGEFMMGSPWHEAERDNDEGPLHKVTIAKPFAIGNLEITFADWDACVAAGGCKRKPETAWGRGRQPVMDVSWNDTQEYVAWLSRKTSKTYRLLTEAEWEYAARAGTTTPFSTGREITTDQANFDGNYTYGGSAKGTYRQRTVEVGSFKHNAFGLHDMHGNVWEWVEDCYEWTYNGAPTDGSGRIASGCVSRVLRGGSWSTGPQFLRAAVRNGARPDFSSNTYGFRVARAIRMDVQSAGLPEKPQPREPVPQIQPRPIAVSPNPSPARCGGVETFVANERRCLLPKENFRDCPTCPEMVVVPVGGFTLGSPTSELERTIDEVQIRVSIAQSFAVGKFAITFDEWDDCIANGGCNGYKPADQGWGRGKHPVINVNWDDARAYAAWLSHKTGKVYRLPSEAEREYVTRADTTTPFWWGSSISTAQANYDGNSTFRGGSKGEYRQRTVPVDSFLANPWGVYDVHGNVFDWTEDCWNETNTGNPGDGSARTSGDCSHRVVRGGSWASDPRHLRSAFRGRSISVARNTYQGVRLARTLDAAGPTRDVTVPIPVPARSQPDHSQTSQNHVIARASRRLESGDVLGARDILLEAEDGSQGPVFFALAETYDPNMLTAWGVRGVAADVARARALYRKALSLGVASALGRLEALK
jgi:formylglycine-generating enzyme required for sulfatase activity